MFEIQDPRYENGRLLNEALLEACENALYGSGTYAFVSADGIKLLMENETFEDFITQGNYELIIGMDEITNTRTLAAIKMFCSQYPNLSVKAFIHNTKGSTYHPKYSWFRYKNGGMLVLGSGNLTAKGLRRNTEAFVTQRVNEEEILLIEKKWADWVNSSRECIKPLQDPEVIVRAEENMNQIIKNTKITDWNEENGAWKFALNSEVLIAEIAAGRGYNKNKHYQVDFDIHTGNTFFGTEFYPKKNIILRKVTSQGFIENIETRTINIAPNKKYQIELTPHENEEKMAKGFPFAIFVKLSLRTFLYTVIVPDDRGYRQVKKEMESKCSYLNNLMMYQSNVEALRDKISSLAILEYLNK
nr:phospholipase D family protein [uncultured Aminipila sp.]